MKVGLVGLHIVHKTFWAPQWVWSTFEHIDNVPSLGDPEKSADKGKTPYSFYNPETAKLKPPAADCRVQRPGVIPAKKSQWYRENSNACNNLQIIKNSHPSSTGEDDDSPIQIDGKLIPNQVTRLDPITKSRLNSGYRNKLKEAGSVFQYFELVNTQWPLNGRSEPIETTINMQACNDYRTTNCYELKPPGLRLRNTTMETFQVAFHENPDESITEFSSAGCMQCHGHAGLDFSFAWTDAAEEIVPIVQDNLGTPPWGSYRQSCSERVMNGTQLRARCQTLTGDENPTTLENAHLCTGDIANINGKLFCNPPLGSFSLTCDGIDIENDFLKAQCLKSDGSTRVLASLKLDSYEGVIENCDGVLTKGRCQ